MPISTPRPPHRLERLRSWMDAERCRLRRGLRRRQRELPRRVLALLRRPVGARPRPGRQADARRDARRGSVAERLRRGRASAATASVASASSWTPSPSSSRRPAPSPAFARAIGSVLPPSCPLRMSASAPRSPPPSRMRVPRCTGSGSSRTGTSSRRSEAGYELCWIGQRAVGDGAEGGASEIEIYTAAQSTAQIATGGPIEFSRAVLSGPTTAEVCCPVHVAGTRRAGARRACDRRRGRADSGLLG